MKRSLCVAVVSAALCCIGRPVFADAPPAGLPATLAFTLAGSGTFAGSYQLAYLDNIGVGDAPAGGYFRDFGGGSYLSVFPDDGVDFDNYTDVEFVDQTAFDGDGFFGSAVVPDFGSLSSLNGFSFGYDLTAGVAVAPSDAGYSGATASLPEPSGVAAALVPCVGLMRRPRRQVR